MRRATTDGHGLPPARRVAWRDPRGHEALMEVTGIGIWSGELRYGDAAAVGDAGADHLCVQAYTGPEQPGLPRAAWRALAPAVVGLTRT
jgi:hypothetical protein